MEKNAPKTTTVPCCFAALLVSLFCAAWLSVASAVTVEVCAGERALSGVPVFCELPRAFWGAQSFTLTRLDTGTAVPGQKLPGEPPRLVWLLRDPLAAGARREYGIQVSEASSPAVATCEQDEAKALLSVQGKPVLQYNLTAPGAPEGVPEYYRRSGYLHPVYGPGGQRLTGDFPPDHRHQHGLMFPWTKTHFEGQEVDFWNLKKQQGTIEHVAVEQAVSGPVFAQLNTSLRHVVLRGEERVPALNETWSLRVYAFTDVFVVDFESRQSCAGDQPLELPQYHYGGMAFRGNDQWIKGGCEFLTSEGKTRADSNHTRARWCDIRGEVDGKLVGATVLCHPDNFRAPQPVRVHPDVPYFCFCPSVLGPWTIEPGKPLVSKYRLVLHSGECPVDRVKQLWADFASPAKTAVIPD